jgi:hypothetical protein
MQIQNNNPYEQFEVNSELVTLSSRGYYYPEIEGKPLTEVEVFDLVTQDENILLSPKLIESGELINVLLKKKVKTPYPIEKFTIGDRLQLLIYIRSTMDNMYNVELIDPQTKKPFPYSINLHELNEKELKDYPDKNTKLFEYKLPKSGRLVKFRLMTGEDEKIIQMREQREQQLRNTDESFYNIFKMEQVIVSIEGIDEKDSIAKSKFIRGMNMKDGRLLNAYMDEVMPSIDLNVEVTTPSGERFQTKLPFTKEFFYPTL